MAARRDYGLLCPEGHGTLVDRDEWRGTGVVWCPHSGHGGNGRFYRLQEVKEGWFDPSVPPIKSEWQVEQEAKAAAAAEARRKYEVEKAAEAVEAKVKAPRVRKPKEPRECKCGCGEMTKGGIFRPGHDARYHSALAKEQGAKVE